MAAQFSIPGTLCFRRIAPVWSLDSHCSKFLGVCRFCRVRLENSGRVQSRAEAQVQVGRDHIRPVLLGLLRQRTVPRQGQKPLRVEMDQPRYNQHIHVHPRHSLPLKTGRGISRFLPWSAHAARSDHLATTRCLYAVSIPSSLAAGNQSAARRRSPGSSHRAI